jgi:Uncharacterized paraquat-inducible protein A
MSQYKGEDPLRVEKQTRFNEWLLGSTILCQSCGCLWLVPAAQKEDSYLCRQCGSEVTTSAKPINGERGDTGQNTY